MSQSTFYYNSQNKTLQTLQLHNIYSTPTKIIIIPIKIVKPHCDITEPAAQFNALPRDHSVQLELVIIRFANFSHTVDRELIWSERKDEVQREISFININIFNW